MSKEKPVEAEVPAKEVETKVQSTEVAVAQNTQVSTDVVDFEEDAGMGLSGITAKDLTVPYFSILQALSAQLSKQDPAYIKGAEQGMFLNSATGQTYDGEAGVIVVLCDYTRRHTEWITRDKGGGFVADHGSNAAVLANTTRDDKGRNITPTGNQIVESGDYAALVVDEKTGNVDRVLISMSGTQLKKSRKLNTLIDGFKMTGKNGKFTPAIFTRAYKFTTVPESNDKGDWYGFEIEPYKLTIELFEDADEGKALYLEAKNFSAQIRTGAAKVNVESGLLDSEIPF